MSDLTFHDGWIIRENGYQAERENARATVFALANGYMGHRGAGEELSAATPGLKGTLVSGVYDTPDGKLTDREVVNLPDLTMVAIKVDGEKFDLATGKLVEYSRELDMRRGVVTRNLVWQSPAGKRISLRTERFLSMTRVHVGAMRLALRAIDPATITLTSGITTFVASSRPPSPTSTIATSTASRAK